MTQYQGSYDKSQGNPNLSALQYLQDNWTPADMAIAKTRGMKVLKVVVSADATAGIVLDIPAGSQVIDAWAIATATNASGSAVVKNGASNMSTPIVMAVDQALARMVAGVDDTKLAVGATDVIKLHTNGAADRGLVYIAYL